MATVCASSNNNSEEPRSKAAGAPTYEAIAAFMARYAPRMPEHPSRGIAPFEYNGCDYALALYACFPARCLDLTHLCWSLQPLESQLSGNLQVFCAAAKSLGLADTPVHALEPRLLQPTASCTVFHIHVQHWLCSLAMRFPPSQGFDPTAVRAMHRWRQVGEPYLKRRRLSLTGRSSGTAEDCINDPEIACGSVKAAPCIAADRLQSSWADTFAPTPAYTAPAPLPDTVAVGEHNQKLMAQPASGKENVHNSTSASDRPKPWLNYSKPWRLPALNAAKVRKEEAQAEAERRKAEARSRDPTRTAFALVADNLQDQYVASQDAVSAMRDSLSAIRDEVVRKMFDGHTTVDFTEVIEKLKHVGPSKK